MDQQTRVRYHIYTEPEHFSAIMAIVFHIYQENQDLFAPRIIIGDLERNDDGDLVAHFEICLPEEKMDEFLTQINDKAAEKNVGILMVPAELSEVPNGKEDAG